MTMTTSVTRSRRAEGLRHPHPDPNAHHPQLTATARLQNNQNFALNSHRTKRHLEASGANDFDHVPKKTRFTTGIAVEIPSRPSSFHSRNARETCDAKSQQVPAKSVATGPNRPNPTPTPPTTTTTTAAAARSTSTSTSTRAAINTTTTSTQVPAGLTKHKEKVVNGLKHELNRLQPIPVEVKDQGRKLRSQEASRFKSELSAYFPDYDEVIGNDPKEQHILNLDTPIIIVDRSTPQPAPQHTLHSPDRRGSLDSHPHDSYPIRSYGDALFTDLFDSQTIDFSFLETRYKGKSLEDPLPDSFFEPAHKKAERLERSIRNSEKGRAQHEKDQIIRLLDCLQGPDWLRVMGVSGITESRKKKFEPARAHFIKGCQAILEKFRAWAAEEKRRKHEKERAIAEAEALQEASTDDAEEAEEDDDEEENEDVADEAEQVEEAKPTEGREVADSNDDMGDADENADDSDGDPPDYSDVDASIAKQLREEAIAAAKKSSRRTRRGGALPPPPAPEPYKEFTSFFRKKYQRDAALSKNRRRGRKAMAWGQAVPDTDERDFQLPEEFCDEETLKAHARRKRRDKRGKH
ncbi:something about silencing, SAS, complex subunit 4-domain-containing protein [Podospora appendiculata]|uniref:Something about silencing, SAS, complex subunit 4-domain-containing protein n=1 Tax=Podospora appendiculata TaxID=314037 RepID=A0AAE0XIH2_9PEZI|nr:something about silencing, SAS, complex subunit 4-domain-containing protein [Podospora appendiculata]